jgi:Domain of unknown function (DUF4126)
METAFSIALGIGLSAACGFRVFVPLLIMSAAASAGHLTLSSGFEWIGSLPALIAFGTATVLEVLAYYIPWLGHLLDMVATPAAVVAGIVASASAFTDMSPLLRWTLALIGGGGIAGLVQGATVLTRIKSTALTGGLGHPVVSTAELVGSVATSLLAILAPVLCVVIIAAGIYVVFRVTGRLLFGGRRTKTS